MPRNPHGPLGDKNQVLYGKTSRQKFWLRVKKMRPCSQLKSMPQMCPPKSQTEIGQGQGRPEPRRPLA